MNDDLPQLPECSGLAGYTDNQMRAYARAALAVRGEPVAWIDAGDLALLRSGSQADFVVGGIKADGDVPLYTAPQAPTLTDEQIDAAMQSEAGHVFSLMQPYRLNADSFKTSLRAIARAILAAAQKPTA